MNYYSTKFFAEKWGRSVSKIQEYCRNGQIPGCRMTGGKWQIPETSIKPVERKSIPFLLMYYNCIQTGFDIRTTSSIPYVQKFIALDYSAQARSFLIQMGYIDKDGICTPAGIEMMEKELTKQQRIALGKWAFANIPQYLQFLPYFLGG